MDEIPTWNYYRWEIKAANIDQAVQTDCIMALSRVRCVSRTQKISTASLSLTFNI